MGLDDYLTYILDDYLKNDRDLTDFTDEEVKVNRLTLADVNAALRKYISNDKITFIYAGDFTKK